MAFYGYKGDAGECHWTPYTAPFDYDYDSVSTQSSFTYPSSYEFDKSIPIKYHNSSSCYDYCDSFITPEVNYSVYNKIEPNLIQYEPIDYYDSSPLKYANYSTYSYSEPKLIQYEPSSYARVYYSSKSKSNVSEEFNAPEFEKYDPTPYSGGYDPATTYGNPLPVSDAICYPRSTPQSDGVSLEGFSYGSVPSPYGKDEDHMTKPPNGKKPSDVDTKPQTLVEIDDKVSTNDDGSEIGDLNENRDYKWPLYSEVQMPHIPYGSGLESLDLCESIFGYWPCLEKRDQKRNEYCQVCCDHQRRNNPWETAADYLFGSPLTYDQGKNGGYQDHFYNYGGYYN